MAELLSVQLHIPIRPDVSSSRSKYHRSTSSGESTPSRDSSKIEPFTNLASRRAVEIEYNDLTYRVPEGRHKG